MEWWHVSSSGAGPEQKITLIDKASVQRVGEYLVRAWTYDIRETSDPAKPWKAMVLKEFHCPWRTMTVFAAIRIGPKDEILQSETYTGFERGSNIYADPGTVAEAEWRFLCQGPDGDDVRIPSSPEEYAIGWFKS